MGQDIRKYFLVGMMMVLSSLACAGSNLVVNGSFDNTNDPLSNWTYKYDTGNALVASNALHVAVTNDGARPHVLALTADYNILWVIGQGVMVDSDPIPLQPGGKYKLTISARSTGPNCRILVEGYRWRPGIKPHPHPALSELRKCYRFNQVYFGPDKTGNFGNVGPNWDRASQTFPEDKLSPLAQESYNKIQFLIIHIIAINVINSEVAKGGDYSLFVDDVVLEYRK